MLGLILGPAAAPPPHLAQLLLHLTGSHFFPSTPVPSSPSSPAPHHLTCIHPSLQFLAPHSPLVLSFEKVQAHRKWSVHQDPIPCAIVSSGL